MPERKCALYTRTSTLKTAMVDAQLALLRSRVDFQNESSLETAWVIAGEYREEDASANNLDRPVFKRLLADIEDGKIDVVIVAKLDRICRSLNNFYSFIELLGKHGVEFISLKECFDTTTAIGQFQMSLHQKINDAMGGDHA